MDWKSSSLGWSAGTVERVGAAGSALVHEHDVAIGLEAAEHRHAYCASVAAPPPGPPSKTKSGSSFASRRSAGATTIFRSIVRPRRSARFSNTWSWPQNASGGPSAIAQGCRRSSAAGRDAAWQPARSSVNPMSATRMARITPQRVCAHPSLNFDDDDAIVVVYERYERVGW